MMESNLEKEIDKSSFLKNVVKIIALVITTLLIWIIIYAIKSGIFQDKNVLLKEIKHLGAFAPIFFMLIQLLQVIFPIIPGGTSSLIGVLAFGPILGFIYNYIGIIFGSIFAYFLSKKYGLKIISLFFKEETIQKYIGYITNHQFPKLFLIGILLPGLPDDLLCYMAGISGLKLKTFLWIILLGKSFSLLFYSLLIHFL